MKTETELTLLLTLSYPALIQMYKVYKKPIPDKLSGIN